TSINNGAFDKIIRNRRLFNGICLPNQMRVVILIENDGILVVTTVERIIWIIIDTCVDCIAVDVSIIIVSINEMITNNVVLNGIIIVVSNNKITSTRNGVLDKIVRNRRLFNDTCLPSQMRVVIRVVIILIDNDGILVIIIVER